VAKVIDAEKRCAISSLGRAALVADLARRDAPSVLNVDRHLLKMSLRPPSYSFSLNCSDCFRLERLPDGICTHWKAPPLHGAHPKRTSAR